MPESKKAEGVPQEVERDKKETTSVAKEGSRLSNKLIGSHSLVTAPTLKGNSKAAEPKNEKKIGTAYATGRRKESVARVWVSHGTGKFSVNRRGKKDYFHSFTQMFRADRPLAVLGSQNKYDVKCTVKGGGVSGQADAVSLGIARALCILDSTLKPSLKKEQLLKRNDKVVERKKYGRHKARKKPQFSKR